MKTKPAPITSITGTADLVAKAALRELMGLVGHVLALECGIWIIVGQASSNSCHAGAVSVLTAYECTRQRGVAQYFDLEYAHAVPSNCGM